MPAAFTPSHRGGSGAPLVLVHGFTDTWRTWELVLPALERRHDVLAPTLAGHAGGPPADGLAGAEAVLDRLEADMDAAGFATAHVAGNSLGGWLALKLAERGRARSVVALAPGGGWADGDEAFRDELVPFFAKMREATQLAAPHADAIVATADGRRRATREVSVRFEHLPPDLIAHQLCGVAACDGAPSFIESALRDGWPLEAERVTCPVRFVWGTEDRLLPWPRAAARWQAVFPQADWVVLDDVGHSPQLDVPAATADLVLGWTA